MSPIITFLLAGTILSTALKVGILMVGAKAYRDRHPSASPSAPDHGWLATLRARLDRWTIRGQPATSVPETPRVLAWVQATLALDNELGPWLTALSTSEAQALIQDIIAFCATWQLELPWLFEPPFASFPELQAQLGALVLAYCRARRAAQQFQAIRFTALESGK